MPSHLTCSQPGIVVLALPSHVRDLSHTGWSKRDLSVSNLAARLNPMNFKPWQRELGRLLGLPRLRPACLLRRTDAGDSRW